jgi:hypothetical protein
MAQQTNPSRPSGSKVNANFPTSIPGENLRGETTACPTGLSSPQAEQPQQPGGGGAPGTGDEPGLTGVPYSPGEGVSERQRDASK